MSHPAHPVFSEGGIFFPVILLSGIGVVMVYSASSDISMALFNTHAHYLKRQAFFCILSVAAMFTAASFPYRFYRPLAYVAFFTATILLVAVLCSPLNVEVGGARRWLNMGSFTFQPAEFAKLALIIYLAYSLSKKQGMIRQYTVGFIPHVAALAVFSVLILMQPDFGTVVIMAVITWCMMFVAGVPLLHLVSPAPLLVPLFYFLVWQVDYRMERILGFLNPWQDPLDTGYQITHSLKALGSGGIFGKGVGLGMQKCHYLPEPHTDFIFAIIGEELGLVGVLLIYTLYSIVLFHGARIAMTSKDTFGSILAAGLTVSLGLQVIINTGVALGALPTKGLTLPFLSYGGTSLLVNMTAMGILINIGASRKND